MPVSLSLLGVAFCLLYIEQTAANFNRTLKPWPGYNDKAYFLRELLGNLSGRATLRTRPVLDSHSFSLTMMTVRISRILDLDVREQMFTFIATVWINYQHDLMKWNPADHYNITDISIGQKQVWEPDIFLMNGVMEYHMFDTNILLRCYSEGYIFHSVPKVYKVPCEVFLYNFPFDVQVCRLDFGSLNYETGKFFYVPMLSDGDDFVNVQGLHTNREWILVDSFSDFVNVTRDGRVYEEIRVYVQMKRFSDFYVQFLMIPSAALSLVILTLFWIPVVRPDRILVGMSTFGLFIMLLLMVIRISSPTGNIKIGMYYCLNIILVALSTFLSAVNLSLSSATRPVPRPVRTVFVLGIGRVFGISQQYETLYNVDVNDRVLMTIRDWQVVATSIERINFIIYVICLSVGFVFLFPFPGAHTSLEHPPMPMEKINATGIHVNLYET